VRGRFGDSRENLGAADIDMTREQFEGMEAELAMIESDRIALTRT